MDLSLLNVVPHFLPHVFWLLECRIEKLSQSPSPELLVIWVPPFLSQGQWGKILYCMGEIITFT
uniref:Uncharacterized protein n=1 Tax=Arundo donax TaxID=35708 RepID=A0A0A8XUV2_ARUDO